MMYIVSMSTVPKCLCAYIAYVCLCYLHCSSMLLTQAFHMGLFMTGAIITSWGRPGPVLTAFIPFNHNFSKFHLALFPFLSRVFPFSLPSPKDGKDGNKWNALVMYRFLVCPCAYCCTAAMTQNGYVERQVC